MGTYTCATLVVSNEVYQEIYDKLKQAGYDHAFMDNGVIDMHGIGLKKQSNTEDKDDI